MADDADKPKLPEDIEKELSVSNFAKQQGRTLAFQFGGLALGWFVLGKGLAKTGLTDKVAKWFKSHPPEEARIIARDWVIPGIGAIIGSTLGGIASLYEHWVKVEREQLSVKEINKDVAALMAKRVQFEERLDKQDTLVDEMLTKQKSFTAALPHRTADGKPAMAEMVQSQRESDAAEPSRA